MNTVTTNKDRGSKMNLFENGYLKSEYLNKENFRSMRGLEVDVFTELSVKRLKLTAISNGACLFDNGTIAMVENIKIPEFTPTTIPAGEFIWLLERSGRWALRRQGKPNFNKPNHRKVVLVPLIVANGHLRAVEVKEWCI